MPRILGRWLISWVTAKLQGCAKLPVNRQSETSLGKGKKGGKNLTLHVEGFQNLQNHVEGFRNLLKKQLELINKKSPGNFINLKQVV